jgi:hypothetical protein
MRRDGTRHHCTTSKNNRNKDDEEDQWPQHTRLVGPSSNGKYLLTAQNDHVQSVACASIKALEQVIMLEDAFPDWDPLANVIRAACIEGACKVNAEEIKTRLWKDHLYARRLGSMVLYIIFLVYNH